MNSLPTSALTERQSLSLPALVGLIAWTMNPFSVQAQDLTLPLTAIEVVCQEEQLSAMLSRMRIAGTGPTGPQEEGIPWALLLAPGRSVGALSGLGLTSAKVNNPIPFDPRPGPIERHLAFQIATQPEQLLLDPKRPRLPQATIYREETATNLVSPTSEFRLIVSLDTGVSGALGPVATINNFLLPTVGRPYNGFLASSTQPGRGLLGVVGTPCTKKLTDQDHRVLAILRRMLRATFEDVDDGCETCALHSPHKISLFRGEDPHEFLFDAFPYRHNGTHLGRLAGRVTVEWNETGNLTTGRLEIFPRCQTGHDLRCTTTPLDGYIAISPPGFAGISNPPFLPPGSVIVSYLASAGMASQPVPIPFATFLSQSSWN